MVIPGMNETDPLLNAAAFILLYVKCTAFFRKSGARTPSPGILSDFPTDNQQRYLGMSDDVFRDRAYEHLFDI
jgi:hypothetical protein